MGGRGFLESWCILSVGSAIAQLLRVRIRVTPTWPLHCSYIEIVKESSHILCICCYLILHRCHCGFYSLVLSISLVKYSRHLVSHLSIPLQPFSIVVIFRGPLLIFQVVDAFVVFLSKQTKISCYRLWSPWQGAAQCWAGASAARFCRASFPSRVVFLTFKKFLSSFAFLSQGWPSNKKLYFLTGMLPILMSTAFHGGFLGGLAFIPNGVTVGQWISW